MKLISLRSFVSKILRRVGNAQRNVGKNELKNLGEMKQKDRRKIQNKMKGIKSAINILHIEGKEKSSSVLSANMLLLFLFIEWG